MLRKIADRVFITDYQKAAKERKRAAGKCKSHSLQPFVELRGIERWPISETRMERRLQQHLRRGRHSGHHNVTRFYNRLSVGRSGFSGWPVLFWRIESGRISLYQVGKGGVGLYQHGWIPDLL